MNNASSKPENRPLSGRSIGALLWFVAVFAIVVANVSLWPRLEALEEEVIALRSDAAALHVADPEKIVVVGKPRVRFNDLIYQVYIPPNGSFVICGAGGRDAVEGERSPRVMAPLTPGRHLIAFDVQFEENGGQVPKAVEMKISLDGKPSIFLPVELDNYLAAGFLDATLRYRSYVSFEVDEKPVLFDKESSKDQLENLRFWIQQSQD